MAYLGLDRAKKVILNIDESWLDTMDYRRMKWRAYGTTNSVAKKQVAPRISMIMALDTLGNLYATFTQVNTDSNIMAIYMRDLVRKLDRERPQWRLDTVITMDNAPYHVSTGTMSIMKELQVPIMYLGPHSYNVAPVEMLFASIKSTHMNEEMMPTGKR